MSNLHSFSYALAPALLFRLSMYYVEAYFITSPAEAVAKYCDECVCLCVCLSDRISLEPKRGLYQIFVHVAHGRVSILRHVDDRPHRPSAGRG